MSHKNYGDKPKIYEVIGEDNSVFLRRENRYLKKGEKLALIATEAEILTSAGLVVEVKPAVKYAAVEDLSDNKE